MSTSIHNPAKILYDYIVVGGGSGGIASARRAASYGATVLLVEHHRLGGTCVNVGCVPKKIMYYAATLADAIKDSAAYGFSTGPAERMKLNWKLLKERRDKYIVKLHGIYENNLKKDGIEIVRGRASLEQSGVVKVDGARYKGKHILIATGSHPRVPSDKDIPGASLGITSDQFFELERQPQSVVIVGAGYIAVELAGIFNSLGSKVKLMCRHETVLRTFDVMIQTTVTEELGHSGIDVVSHSQVKSVERAADGLLRIHYHTNAAAEMLVSEGHDCLLWAIGRDAQDEALDLQQAAVSMDRNGYVEADEFQNTTAPAVYALGDVCGKAMLTPVAIAAGRSLADRLFGNKPDTRLDYDMIPSVIFGHPPIGSIGLTEQQAITTYGAAAIKIYTARFTNLFYGIFDYGDERPKPPTVYKLIVTGKEERIVGLHIAGLGSDEILQGFAVAIKMGATKKDFDRTVAIHPTAAEELVTMR